MEQQDSGITPPNPHEIDHKKHQNNPRGSRGNGLQLTPTDRYKSKINTSNNQVGPLGRDGGRLSGVSTRPLRSVSIGTPARDPSCSSRWITSAAMPAHQQGTPDFCQTKKGAKRCVTDNLTNKKRFIAPCVTCTDRVRKLHGHKPQNRLENNLRMSAAQ